MLETTIKANIQVKRDERVYQFQCANDASLGEIYDVMKEMAIYIVNRINEIEQIQKPEDSQEAAKEE